MNAQQNSVCAQFVLNESLSLLVSFRFLSFSLHIYRPKMNKDENAYLYFLM